MILRLALFIFPVLLQATTTCSFALPKDDDAQIFRVDKVVKNVADAPFEQWLEQLPNRPIERVVVRAKRDNGAARTTLTLELNGSALPEGSRIVDRSTLHSITWDLRSQRPRATQIELEASEGDVFVESVTIDFVRSSRAALGYSERVPDETFKQTEKLTEQLDEAVRNLVRQAGRDRTLRAKYPVQRSAQRFASEIDKFENSLRTYRNHLERLLIAVANLRQSFNGFHRELSAAKPYDSETILLLKDADEALLELERELGGRPAARAKPVPQAASQTVEPPRRAEAPLIP